MLAFTQIRVGKRCVFLADMTQSAQSCLAQSAQAQFDLIWVVLVCFTVLPEPPTDSLTARTWKIVRCGRQETKYLGATVIKWPQKYLPSTLSV